MSGGEHSAGPLARLDRPGRFIAAEASLEEASAVLFGIPMDFTTSYRPGTRLGPTRIREASWGLETYSPELDRDLMNIQLADIGDVPVAFGNPSRSLDAARAVADELHALGKKPLGLGGEHLVSLPLILAAHARHPDLAVLHFDAHADLRPDYLGEALSHATVMRRVAERIGARNCYHFGIRSGTAEEFALGREAGGWHPFEVLAPLQARLPELVGRPVYVTIDVDVLDPAFAPGTGTPEPGGITSLELLQAVRLLGQLQIVAADVVEVLPAMDLSERTALVAAKVIRELLLAW